MDILGIAGENYAATLLVVLTVGFIQGGVMGRGIRNRFPGLRRHARLVSSILLILFTINSIAGILKFAVPEKFPTEELVTPATTGELFTLTVSILGLGAGFGAVIAASISVLLIVVFRFAVLPTIARYFVLIMNSSLIAVAVLARFTDYTPSEFEVIIYMVYQFGLTAGIFLITRKKEKVVW